MNKDHIVNAFDSIKPTEIQKEKMLENILNKKNKTGIHMIKIVPVISSVAACLLVFCAVYVYSNIYNHNTGISVMDSSKVQKIENTEENNNVVIDAKKESEEADYNLAEKKEFRSKKDYEVAADDYVSGEVYNSSVAKAENILMFNDISLFLSDVSLSSFAAEKSTESGLGGENSDELIIESDESYRTEIISENDYENMRQKYFDYLGEDFTSLIQLPSDMSEIKDETIVFPDANNNLVSDVQSFGFSGNNGRMLNVITTKDTSQANMYFSDENIIKTLINDIETVLFADDKTYASFIVKNEISYELVSYSLDEEEFKNVLFSITK